MLFSNQFLEVLYNIYKYLVFVYTRVLLDLLWSKVAWFYFYNWDRNLSPSNVVTFLYVGTCPWHRYLDTAKFFYHRQMLRKFFFHIFLFRWYRICKIKTRGNCCTYQRKIGVWKNINQFIKKINLQNIHSYLVYIPLSFSRKTSAAIQVFGGKICTGESQESIFSE